MTAKRWSPLSSWTSWAEVRVSDAVLLLLLSDLRQHRSGQADRLPLGDCETRSLCASWPDSCVRVVDGSPPVWLCRTAGRWRRGRSRTKPRRSRRRSSASRSRSRRWRPDASDPPPPPPPAHPLSRSQDLEEQSRLIAASSRPANPPAADGQFLLLSSSQSEDSDVGEEGKKRGESEA